MKSKRGIPVVELSGVRHSGHEEGDHLRMDSKAFSIKRKMDQKDKAFI